MANPEHVDILRQGVEVWNGWRRGKLRSPDLSGFDFDEIEGRYFVIDVIDKADLTGIDFSSANLEHANLEGVKLTHALLTDTLLKRANLSQTILDYTNFTSANLSNADLSGALLYWTIFADTNLEGVEGLESCYHYDRSIIDFYTLLKSGNIHPAFLHACGLPRQFIERVPAIIASMEPLQFHSCFISYSSLDQEFAERLRADLLKRGVPVWVAPYDLRIGAPIRLAIDQSIRDHDKLLLVLSENSVASQWVEQEVETALAKERESGHEVLFPVRLDDSVMEMQGGWPQFIRNTRNIGDFTRWKEYGYYQGAFERLLRDLQA